MPRVPRVPLRRASRLAAFGGPPFAAGVGCNPDYGNELLPLCVKGVEAEQALFNDNELIITKNERLSPLKKKKSAFADFHFQYYKSL
jgi:hypothetical protein